MVDGWNVRSRHRHQKSCRAAYGPDAAASPVKPGVFGSYGEDVPQFVFDCCDASAEGDSWIWDEIEWSDIFSYVYASSSLRVPSGTEQDVLKVFCIPLGMYTLSDGRDGRDTAS